MNKLQLLATTAEVDLLPHLTNACVRLAEVVDAGDQRHEWLSQGDVTGRTSVAVV
jgi:hypothetical protein